MSPSGGAKACQPHGASFPLATRWLGLVPYADALAAQRAYRDQVIAGLAPGGLWLLEHPPVVTSGRRMASVDDERVLAAGFARFECERGGLATCHEPGQLVGYLVANVREAGVRCTVSAIEDGLIASLRRMGLVGGRRQGFPGVWVENAKVAAIGLHVRQGVTLHGFALNVCNDLRGFDLIVPCGIAGVKVTSLVRLGAPATSPAAAWASVGQDVVDALMAVGVGLTSLDSARGGE